VVGSASGGAGLQAPGKESPEATAMPKHV